MHRSSKILQFCLVIYTIISQTKAQFQFLESFCTNSSTFALNSTYNSSINTLLQSLSANATYNPIGYYNISVGDTAENTVHGYFLCRGDLDNSACSACVSTMVAQRQADSVTSYCPASKRQSVYYDKCMYRYSNNILYGQVTIEEVSFYKKSDKDITEEPDGFKESLGRMFRDLALKAANNQTGKKYATAAKKFPASTSVYALVQCTPDLSVADCNACFNYAFQKLSLQYSGEMFMNPSCSARYESYPFFKGAVSLLSPGK